MAEEAMVHPRASERRVRLAYGGRARSLRRALRDPKRPVVCFDEMPYQMVAQTRTPVHPPSPGERCATTTNTNAGGWSTSSPSSSREGMLAASGCHRAAHGGGLRRSHASFGRRALPRGREGAGGPRQPQHSYSGLALQSAFEPAEEARRLLRGLEFHHTPKHASWLNPRWRSNFRHSVGSA